MPTQISSNRKKYAISVREETLIVIHFVMKRENIKSLSGAIAYIISKYAEIQKRNSGAIVQAQCYRDWQGYDFLGGTIARKEQTYLNQLEETCLRAIALQTGGNLSHAVNKIVEEFAALLIVCPNLT